MLIYFWSLNASGSRENCKGFEAESVISKLGFGEAYVYCKNILTCKINMWQLRLRHWMVRGLCRGGTTSMPRGLVPLLRFWKIILSLQRRVFATIVRFYLSVHFTIGNNGDWNSSSYSCLPLSQLEISYNPIGPHGAKALFEVLKSHGNIKTLSLGWCQVVFRFCPPA